MTGPQRTEIGGIPVWWADAPGPVHGALLFRVGILDEMPAERGLTHLVEHLAMPEHVARHGVDCNAVVNETTTAFWAEGERDEVLAFLRATAARLTRLPVERADHQLRVLRAEAEGATVSMGDVLATYRYGLVGIGARGAEEFALARATGEDATDWAAAHFTRGNAVVMLSADPAGLELGLPDGEYRPEATARALPYERLFLDGGANGATVTFAGRRTNAFALGLRILGDRAEQILRHQRGLCYEVGVGSSTLGLERYAVLAADSRYEDSGAVLDGLLEVVQGLAEDGPTERELADDRAAGAREVRSGGLEQLTFTAYAELERRPVLFLEDAVRRDGELAAGDVQSAMRDAVATLHAGGNEDMRPPSGFAPPAAPPAREHPGETFPGRRLMSREKVVLGPDAISLVEKDQQRTTIDRDGVAILGIRSATERVVIDVDATSIGFDGREFRRGDELVAALDAWIPAHLHVPFAAD